MRHAYLVCTSPTGNHNKFYEITENNDKTLDVRYGRVGARGQSITYRAFEKTFDGLIDEKYRHGYRETAPTPKTVAVKENTDIPRPAVREDTALPSEKRADECMLSLFNGCKQLVMETYKTATASEGQLRLAYSYLDTLSRISAYPNPSINRFNDELCKLFVTIPRRISDVYSVCAHGKDDMPAIIEREKKYLDALIAVTPSEERKQSEVKVRPVTYAEEDEILNLLGERRGALVAAYRVENRKTDNAFKKKLETLNGKDTKLLLHGSGGENWWSIINNGLVCDAVKKYGAHYCASGLGKGLYFADDVNKSLNYASGTSGTPTSRYIGVFKVAVGNQMKTSDYFGHMGKADFSAGNLPNGTDSVMYSHVGRRNEYCIYDDAQATLVYLLVCEQEKEKLPARQRMIFNAPSVDQIRQTATFLSVAGDTVIVGLDGSVIHDSSHLIGDAKRSNFKSETEYEGWLADERAKCRQSLER